MQDRDADYSATLPPEMIIISFITLYGLTSLSVYASVHFLIGTNVYDFQGFCWAVNCRIWDRQLVELYNCHKNVWEVRVAEFTRVRFFGFSFLFILKFAN